MKRNYVDGERKLSIQDDFEGCLSLDGKLFIAVFPGEYMGGGNHIFRHDVKNGVLEEAEKVNEVWGEFGLPFPKYF